MQNAFDKILEGLIPEGETALLAVSGGIDSICMAELFARSRLNVHIAVAHCNFHLRGAESDADAELVRSWASAHGAMFHSVDFDTEKYAAEHSQSIEMAARELRYDWFASLCLTYGYYAVSVAHNANDNAETLMLNLLRGTGLRGISGMKPVSEVPVSKPELAGVRLMRPLLQFSRELISDYVSVCHAAYHDDRTNAETVYKRNRIRHLVFPVFESLNPSYLSTFSREMSVFSQENAIADDYFNAVRSRVCEAPGAGECLRVNVQALRAEAHWEYVLYRLLEHFGFKSRTLDPVTALVKGSGTFSGKEFYAAGYRILTSGRCLIVKKGVAVRRGRLPVLPEIIENYGCAVVEGVSVYSFGGYDVKVSLMPSDGDAAGLARSLAGSSALAADAGALTFPFLIRGWRAGDWMCPLGTRGRKKLSDIFTDMKLNRDDKDCALVIVCPAMDKKNPAGEHVAAVCGYASGRFYCRVDEAVKASSGTASLVCIEAVSRKSI